MFWEKSTQKVFLICTIDSKEVYAKFHSNQIAQYSWG